MKELDMNDLLKVCGGIIPALVAFVTVFALPIIIKDHGKQYNDWGHQIGEAVYEHNHPYDPNK